MDARAPDPELVGDLLWGVFPPQWLRLALTIDLFSPLAAGPSSAHEVATDVDCEPVAVAALLDYFGARGLVERRGDRYGLTPTAETFLVRGSRAFVGDMILDYTGPDMYERILSSMRTGVPHPLDEDFVQDAWLESYRTARIPLAAEMWRAAGVEVGGGRAARVLDLGCGCAIKSLVLAQASPDVHVTGLDSPAVLEVAADLARRMGVGEQASFVPADLLTVDLGVGRFDAALAGQITHYLSPEQNRDLLCRVARALTPGGTLVIDCPMTQAVPSEMASFCALFMWANGGGSAHSFETYRELLEASGFDRVERISERWLSARTPPG